MKRIYLLAVALLFCVTAYAQTTLGGSDREYSIDLEVGLQVPVYDPMSNGGDYSIIPFVSLEARYQLRRPIDVGINMSATVIERDNGGKFRTIPFLAIADYQLARGDKVNPYIGLGAGISFNQSDFIPHATHFALSPRIGVRLFKFINIQVGYLFTHKDFSRMYVNIGFYL